MREEYINFPLRKDFERIADSRGREKRESNNNKSKQDGGEEFVGEEWIDFGR